MNRTFKALVLIASAAVMAEPARAADQVIKANLTLNGFNSSSIIVGFTSTDVFDSRHSCNAGSGPSCTAQNGYGSPPKNIGNVLCIPNNLTYAISASCQQLLSQGASQSCQGNNMKSYCGSNAATVAPACNWRTNANKNTVNWNWVLTLQGQGCVITVDCSNSNYQGPQP
jgi:hypothetical protein